MRALRTFCVTGMALLLIPSGLAGAAPACPMLADPRDDVQDVHGLGGVPDDKLDLRSADFAGNRTAFAAEIRVYGVLDEQPDPAAPTGRAYEVIADIGRGVASGGPFVGFTITFDSLGAVNEVWATTFTDPDGNPVRHGSVIPAGYKIDAAQGKIRAWIDYEDFDETSVTVRPGARARRIWVNTMRYTTYTPVAWAVDLAREPAAYRFGAPACIPVGK